MSAGIQLKSRVYLKNAVAGEAGTVMRFVHAKAEVYWPDLNLTTRHAPESLVLDESSHVLDLDGVAA